MAEHLRLVHFISIPLDMDLILQYDVCSVCFVWLQCVGVCLEKGNTQLAEHTLQWLEKETDLPEVQGWRSHFLTLQTAFIHFALHYKSSFSVFCLCFYIIIIMNIIITIIRNCRGNCPPSCQGRMHAISSSQSSPLVTCWRAWTPSWTLSSRKIPLTFYLRYQMWFVNSL